MPEKKQTKKAPPKKKQLTLKITDTDKKTFPYSQFPVKIIHKDGKDLCETKTCYFQSEHYAQKYIMRCKFKKNEYQMFVKP